MIPSNPMWLAVPLQEWGGEPPVEHDTPLTIGLVLFFFALMIGIGLFAGRYQEDEVDYYAAGRRSGLFVIALSGYAAIQSGWGLVGIPGGIYAGGFEVAIATFTPLAFVFAYWLLAKKMRLLGTYKDAITGPDALYHRFKDERVRLIGAISIFLGCMGYLAAQYAALGIIGAVVLPVDFFGALIIGLIVVAIYTVIGGILAAIWSDAIQGLMMALAGPLTFAYILFHVDMGIGEMVSATTQEAPNFFDMATLGGSPALGVGFMLSSIFIMVTIAGQPQLTTRFYMVREISLLKWGAIVSGLGYLLTMFFWLAVPWIRAGVAEGQITEPATPDHAVPIALVESAPEVVIAFALTAIIAAIMSTSNAFLNLAAASIQHDIMQEYYGYDISKAQQVTWGRIITTLVLISAFVIAASFPGLIMVLGAAGWALMAAVLFPGVAIAYNWKGATTEGILWGGSIAVVGTLVLAYGPEYFGIAMPYDFLGGQVAGFIGLIVFFVVSLVTSTNDYADLDDEEIKAIIDTGRIEGGIQDVEIPSPAPDDD